MASRAVFLYSGVCLAKRLGPTISLTPSTNLAHTSMSSRRSGFKSPQILAASPETILVDSSSLPERAASFLSADELVAAAEEAVFGTTLANRGTLSLLIVVSLFKGKPGLVSDERFGTNFGTKGTKELLR
ncbi:hypothetical protein PS2_037451 [Malus domestica]